MSIQDNKITTYADSVRDLPDQVEGRAAWLKAFFDSRTDNEVKTAHNNLVDDLCAEQAAAQIGAVAPAGVVADAQPENGKVSVQGVLDGLQKYVKQQVVAIGAGDMAASVYDADGRREDVFAYAKSSAKHFAAAHARAQASVQGGEVVIRSEVVRDGTDYNVEFEAPCDFALGQAHYIDGEAVRMLSADGEELESGWRTGTPVLLRRRGENAYYGSGGAGGGMPVGGGVFSGAVRAAGGELQELQVRNTYFSEAGVWPQDAADGDILAVYG